MKEKHNILFLHGYRGDWEGSTREQYLIKNFGDIFNWNGFDINFSLPLKELLSYIENYIKDEDIDLIIGFSMGGWLASNIKTEKPVITINPALQLEDVIRLQTSDNTYKVGENYILPLFAKPEKTIILTPSLIKEYLNTDTKYPAEHSNKYYSFISIKDDILTPYTEEYKTQYLNVENVEWIDSIKHAMNNQFIKEKLIPKVKEFLNLN